MFQAFRQKIKPEQREYFKQTVRKNLSDPLCRCLCGDLSGRQDDISMLIFGGGAGGTSGDDDTDSALIT